MLRAHGALYVFANLWHLVGIRLSRVWFSKTWTQPKQLGLLLLIPVAVVGIVSAKEGESVNLVFVITTLTVGFFLYHLNSSSGKTEAEETTANVYCFLCKNNLVFTNRLCHIWISWASLVCNLDIILGNMSIGTMVLGSSSVTLTLLASKAEGGKKNRLLERIKGAFSKPKTVPHAI